VITATNMMAMMMDSIRASFMAIHHAPSTAGMPACDLEG
jgi:hypothetical protein